MIPDLEGVYIVHFASRHTMRALAQSFPDNPDWLLVMSAFAFSDKEKLQLVNHWRNRGC